jgi:ABC-2 type transport system ATP-binding protein
MEHAQPEPSFVSSRAAVPGGCASDASGASGASDGGVVLAARSLEKCYHAGITGCSARADALRGVDVEIHAGEAFGIIGPAGSGKSTLMLCLAGMLRADAGTVAWFGRPADVAGRPPGIAFASRRPAHHAMMSVREAVEYQTPLRGIPIDERVSAVEVALATAGLKPQAALSVADLPAGTLARVALAQAIVARPRILLLDDTLSSVDHATRRALIDVLRRLRDDGVTLVIAAGDLDAIDAIASRVALMLDGRIVAVVAPGVLRSSRALELTVSAPVLARRVFGTRVAEMGSHRRVLRLPLEGTTAEAILARCQACGIRVERSRVVVMRDSTCDDMGDPAAHRP